MKTCCDHSNKILPFIWWNILVRVYTSSTESNIIIDLELVGSSDLDFLLLNAAFCSPASLQLFAAEQVVNMGSSEILIWQWVICFVQ